MYEKGYQETVEHNKDRLIFSEKMLYIIGIPLLTFLLTIFVFHFYRIDGPSMEKTLKNGDRVAIEKVGKTWASITGKQYLPKRYDVVVFKNPNPGGEKELIKRVIALPGERIVVVNNEVRVYNSKNPEGLLVDRGAPAEAFIDDATTGYVDTLLKPGEVFVLGDNRDASYDSRDFGPIKTDVIVGSLLVRIYPFYDVTLY